MTRKLQRALEQQKKDTARENPPLSGDLGIPLNGQRVVEVPNRNGFVYVRLRSNLSEVIQAFNNQVAASYNLPVLLERQGNKYIVLGVDTARYENNWNSFAPYLPRHGNTHSFDLESGGGGDIVWVYPKQFMPALVFPSGSVGAGNVVVSPYTLKKDNGTWMYVGNTGTPNITSYRPTSSTGAIMGLVYLNTDDGNPYLLIGSGTVFSNSVTGSSQVVSYIPQVTNPAKQIPLAAVRLITGTSAISWNNIYDVRQFIHNQPTGTAGGGSITVQDEGVSQGTATTFNFVGDNIQATVSGDTARIFVTGSVGVGGINTGTLDARYLKLDASNDPVTGHLLVSGSVSSTATEIGFSPFYGFGKNNDRLIELEAQYIGSGTVTQPALSFIRHPASGHSPKSISPFVRLYEETGDGVAVGQVFTYLIDDFETISLHPLATGTIPNYIYNSSRQRPTGTIHTSWRVFGAEKAYLDVSGTFYSNGSPLIKEAPVDGSSYVRKSAGWEALSSGQSVLASSITLTGTAAAYQNTGLSVTLPGAGTYLIQADVRGQLTGNAGVNWWIHAQLYNETDAAAVSNSETLIVLVGVSAQGFQSTAPMTVRLTVTGSKVIRLEAARNGSPGATWTASNINSDTNGRTRLSYLRIG